MEGLIYIPKDLKIQKQFDFDTYFIHNAITWRDKSLSNMEKRKIFQKDGIVENITTRQMR